MMKLLVILFVMKLIAQIIMFRLNLSSSFVWIEYTLMLFGLNFTASRISKLMHSALPMIVFFFSTMAWLELLLTGIWN